MGNKFNFYDHQGFTQSKTVARAKRNKQAKRLFRILLLIISSVAILVLLTKLPALVNSIVKPFPNIQNDLTNYNKIDFKYRTNILLITSSANKLKEISLGSLDATDKKVQILSLDPEQKVLGKERDSTLNELFATKNYDEKYLEKLTAKLMETLGLPIDGYIVLSQNEPWQEKDKLESITNEIFSFGFFLRFFNVKAYLDSHLKTNLSISEINTLITKVKNLRPDRFSIIKLNTGEDKQGYLQPSVLSKKGLILADSQITNEELTVEVVNASKVAGAGAVFRNILNNLGVNVVDLTTAPEQGKSELIHKKKATNFEQRITKLFKEKIKTSSDSNIDVDLRLVIGDDLAKYFDF